MPFVNEIFMLLDTKDCYLIHHYLHIFHNLILVYFGMVWGPYPAVLNAFSWFCVFCSKDSELLLKSFIEREVKNIFPQKNLFHYVTSDFSV